MTKNLQSAFSTSFLRFQSLLYYSSDTSLSQMGKLMPVSQYRVTSDMGYVAYKDILFLKKKNFLNCYPDCLDNMWNNNF